MGANASTIPSMPTSSLVLAHVARSGPSRRAASGCGSARAGATSRALPATREAEVLERVDAGVAERQRRTSPGRARATSARRTRSPRTPGGRGSRPGARSIVQTRRVTGRSRTLVSPRMSRIGAMSSSRMCWSMCITISCSPSPSIGETSAARIAIRPDAEQQQPAVRRAGVARPAARARRQRLHVQQRQRQDRRAGRPARTTRRSAEPRTGILPIDKRCGRGLV